MTFYSFLDHIPFLPPKLLTRIKAWPSASPSTVPIRNTTWSSEGGHRNHLCMPGVNERPGKKWLGIVQYEKDETGVLKWGGWLTAFIASIAKDSSTKGIEDKFTWIAASVNFSGVETWTFRTLPFIVFTEQTRP